ncbi:MAG TPA: hypothetical protein VLY83_00680 [Methanoregula sp.]|nr:hypothetical protein [Methanoregula sp.]
MDLTSLKRWTGVFLGILSAILIGSAAARAFVEMSGLTGWPAFITDFTLYAAVLFALLALYERIFRFGFFRFGPS